MMKVNKLKEIFAQLKQRALQFMQNTAKFKQKALQIKQNLPDRFIPQGHDINVSKKSVNLVWYSAGAVFLLLLWAAWAELDQSVRGMGQVVPSQRVQLIQNLEGGIIQEVPVHEGQIIEKDTIVMRIDNESAGSQYREGLVRMLEHEASIARLEALINENDEVNYPPSVMAEPELVKRQNALLRASKIQRDTELEVLALRVESRQRDLAEKEEAKKQALTSLALTEKQRDLALPALKAKAYSEIQFLDIEQKLQETKSNLAILEHAIPRAKAAVGEAEESLKLRKAELVSNYQEELNKIQIELLSLRELITAGDDRVRRTEMRSPVRGIIKAIYASTVGGVVAPGATVMEIVPMDDSLIIEARFNPADIAFLYPGQKAKVRLTAYDFSVYGGMDATVESISADTLQTQQGDTFYKVKVRTTQAHLSHGEESLPILAGMMAEVDVLTGKKTILDYLLKPLLKAQQRALREK